MTADPSEQGREERTCTALTGLPPNQPAPTDPPPAPVPPAVQSGPAEFTSRASALAMR